MKSNAEEKQEMEKKIDDAISKKEELVKLAMELYSAYTEGENPYEPFNLWPNPPFGVSTYSPEHSPLAVLATKAKKVNWKGPEEIVETLSKEVAGTVMKSSKSKLTLKDLAEEIVAFQDSDHKKPKPKPDKEKLNQMRLERAMRIERNEQGIPYF